MLNHFSKSNWLLTLSFLLLGFQSARAEKGSKLRPYRAHNFKSTENSLSSPNPSQTLNNTIEKLKKQMTLSSDDQLVPSRNGLKKPGFRHSKMNQHYKNIPVFGAEVILNETLSSNNVTANIIKGLDRLDINTDPKITANEAFRFATDDYNDNEGAIIPSTLKTVVLELLPKDDGVSLVWHLLILTEAHQDSHSNTKGPGRWHYFVSAEDGSVDKKFNANDTLSQASGPGGNAIYTHSWVNQLDVEPMETGSSTYKAKTTRLATYDMAGSTISGTLVTGILSLFGTAASNEAHGNAEITLNMLSEIFGYNSIDNAGFPIKSFVNYDSNYANAFWDGAEMVYGDGGTTFYPLSEALDVVSHEINHGFTELHSALTYDGEPGGINESFSDIAGTAAEFYSDPSTANFDIAERILKASTGRTALRFMCNPTTDNFSIDNFANYKSTTDVHSSSGIMNKAFCRTAKRFSSNGNPNGNAIGDSVLRVAKIFYEANDNYWLSSSTFLQACEGTLDAATALGYSLTEIDWLKQSWIDVGVVCTSSSNLNAPTLLTATPLTGTSIRLNWADNSTNETGFKIEMKMGAAAYSLLTTTAANAVTYTATVAANQTYSFRVMATNTNGDSTLSNEATTQTLIPQAPTLLTATPLTGTSIRLNWADNSTNETGFKIEMKMGAAAYSLLTTTAANAVTYTATVAANQTYSFRVRATNTNGDSTLSNEATTQTLIPQAPSVLTATKLSATSIRLNWKDNSSNETGFKIEMKMGAAAYSLLTTTAANAVTYTATVAANQTYSFRVRATNANGDSTLSNEATTQTLIPQAPTVLTATKLSATSIRLNWKDNSSNETGFKIERKILGTQASTQFVLVGFNVTTMTTVQTTTVPYVYRIRSFNSFGNSSYSNEISTTLK
ncbi:MAG: hypothetical protein EXR74_00115 [Bdellovibrionales bacterium]|nr:hypothetical protein [Bdellovibrionales bacterium]